MLVTVGPGGSRSLAQQRHERIVREVRMRGAARVADLATLLHVSDMTVRRDLDALHEAGVLVKVHGGATIPTDHTSDEPGFEAKSLRNTDEKVAIAIAAAQFARPGGTVGMTAGTTTWRLAAELASVPNLTVVTNSIRVAQVFSTNPRTDRQMILSGGARTPSDALVGPLAVAALGTLHVDVLFIGVHGMSERAGFTTPNMLEADTNRAFIGAAGRKVVLADHTKWDVTGLSSFAGLSDVDVLVTDRGIATDAHEILVDSIEHVMMVDTGTPTDMHDDNRDNLAVEHDDHPTHTSTHSVRSA
jgi:DeoR/GlpR family transcriptional regulator of sugar metabolism